MWPHLAKGPDLVANLLVLGRGGADAFDIEMKEKHI